MRQFAVVGAIAVALAATGGCGSDVRAGTNGAVATTDQAASGDASPPPGTRWVGTSHAVIAVPVEWGTNLIRCRTPQADTVIIDVFVVPACAVPRPDNVSEVEVAARPSRPTSPDFSKAESIRVSGQPALRSHLECKRAFAGVDLRSTAATAHLCSQAIWIQSEQAFFAATSPDPLTVRQLLASVRVLSGHAAVPTRNVGVLTGREQGNFVAAAQALRLRVDVSNAPFTAGAPGALVVVDPAPGTVLPEGSTIRLVVADRPPQF